MTERKYSVSEIDRMRSSVRSLMTSNSPWHHNGNGMGKSRTSYPPQPANVEEQLRTYMLAGTDPEELETIAKAHDE